MSDIIAFDKTYSSSLTKRGIIVPEGEPFVRLTQLPEDWKRIRIALICSPTNLVDDNGTPNAETCYYSSSENMSFHLGMSSSGEKPWISGNKFVGISSQGSGSSAQLRYVDATYGWNIFANGSYPANPYVNYYPSLKSSASFSRGSTVLGGNYDFRMAGGPQSDTSWALYLGLDLNVSTAGVLSVAKYSAYSQSVPTGLALNAILAASYGTAYTVSGGWWNASTPVGCQYLSLFWPFLSNRMRYFGMEVMQLA